MVEAGLSPDTVDAMSFRDMQLALAYVHNRPAFR